MKGTVRPHIGITCRALEGNPQALGSARVDGWWLHRALVESCRKIGGLPIPITAPAAVSLIETGHEAADWIDNLDALILGGGGDIVVGPEGETLNAQGFAASTERDTFEYALLAHALAKSIPVLGICRGAQLIQLAAGGSLLEPPAELSALHCRPQDYVEHHHALVLDPGGLLAEGSPSLVEVNSAHRWRIGALAPGLRVEATCPMDDSIEAFSSVSGSFVLGVLWHPEFELEHERALPGSVVFSCFRNAIVTRELRAPSAD